MTMTAQPRPYVQSEVGSSSDQGCGGVWISSMIEVFPVPRALIKTFRPRANLMSNPSRPLHLQSFEIHVSLDPRARPAVPTS